MQIPGGIYIIFFYYERTILNVKFKQYEKVNSTSCKIHKFALSRQENLSSVSYFHGNFIARHSNLSFNEVNEQREYIHIESIYQLYCYFIRVFIQLGHSHRDRVQIVTAFYVRIYTPKIMKIIKVESFVLAILWAFIYLPFHSWSLSIAKSTTKDKASSI